MNSQTTVNRFYRDEKNCVAYAIAHPTGQNGKGDACSHPTKGIVGWIQSPVYLLPS